MPRKPKPAPPKRRQRGSGSISTLADGTIRARLPASVDPKRTAREFRPGQLAEAEAWLDSRLHPPPPVAETTTVTLGAWAGLWHQTYVAPILAPNSSKWYLYALRQLQTLYSAPLADLRASALQAIVGQLGATLDGATVQAIVGVWRRCLEAAVDDELVERNPAKRLVAPRAAPRTVKRHVTPAEVAALWPEIVGERFEAAFALILGCGLRIGEILGLSWANVDLEHARAWIGPQFTNGHWRPAPKGRNPHWITLPPRVVAALIRHRNAQPPGAVLVLQSPHIDFGRPRRKRAPDQPGPRPWSPARISHDLAEVCKRAGLDPFTAHAGRRGLLTALLDGGVSPAVAAEIAGHADPGVTLRNYVQPSIEGRARAAKVVDAYLGGIATGTETAS